MLPMIQRPCSPPQLLQALEEEHFALAVPPPQLTLVAFKENPTPLRAVLHKEMVVCAFIVEPDLCADWMLVLDPASLVVDARLDLKGEGAIWVLILRWCSRR